MNKLVAVGISVPDSDYCYQASIKKQCRYYNNLGHISCDIGFEGQRIVDGDVTKSVECIKLRRPEEIV